MSTRWFGRRAGFAAARYLMIALCIAGVMRIETASGQGTAQAPLTQPPMDTSPKPWTGKRLPDGQPDLQGGVWYVPSGGTRSVENLGETHQTSAGLAKETRGLSRIVDPPDGRIPHQPWALARQKEQELGLDNPTKPEHVDPQARCIQGFPRYHYYVSNYRILQPPGMVIFAFELYHVFRVIRLDGSPHIGPSMKLWWGDSVGRWDGNTLVVDTTNLNGKIRVSMKGDFITDQGRLRERFVVVDANTIIYEVTIDDPTVYTRPWTMRVEQKRGPRDPGGENPGELWEDTCHEGQESRPSLMPAYNPGGPK